MRHDNGSSSTAVVDVVGNDDEDGDVVFVPPYARTLARRGRRRRVAGGEFFPTSNTSAALVELARPGLVVIIRVRQTRRTRLQSEDRWRGGPYRGVRSVQFNKRYTVHTSSLIRDDGELLCRVNLARYVPASIRVRARAVPTFKRERGNDGGKRERERVRARSNFRMIL